MKVLIETRAEQSQPNKAPASRHGRMRRRLRAAVVATYWRNQRMRAWLGLGVGLGLGLGVRG